MSNAVKGLIEAKLEDGTTVKLLFDFNTWVDAEEATGLKANELLQGLKDKTLSAKHQRALFWAALREHQPDITEREAGKMLVELADALGKAVDASLPQPDAQSDEEADDDVVVDPPAESLGTGTAS